MRWLGGIIDSREMSKLQEIVEDRGAWIIILEWVARDCETG